MPIVPRLRRAAHLPDPSGAKQSRPRLAFASAAQREHGLPPDDECALRLNETQLVVTVPEGRKPGDSFEVKMEFGARAPHCTGSRCTGSARRTGLRARGHRALHMHMP